MLMAALAQHLETPRRARSQYDEFGFNDGYDYSKHLREMGGGTFVAAPGMRGQGGGARSEASAALSQLTRASRASRAGEIMLRETAAEAFETGEELPSAVGGTVGYDYEQVTPRRMLVL